MTHQCGCRIHPDGFNGDLPRLGEMDSWVPCPYPAMAVLTQTNIDPPMPVCLRHLKLIYGLS